MRKPFDIKKLRNIRKLASSLCVGFLASFFLFGNIRTAWWLTFFIGIIVSGYAVFELIACSYNERLELEERADRERRELFRRPPTQRAPRTPAARFAVAPRQDENNILPFEER